MVNLAEQYDPAEIYTLRLSQFTAKIQATRKRLKRLAFLRLLIFLLTFVMAIVATRWTMMAILIIILSGITAFLLTVMHYLKLQRELKKDENLATINANELQALNGNFSMFEDGDEFNDPDHPFADDLDIFGRQGIFQFINRSATSLGKDRLAQWFLGPFSDTGKIKGQQEAVGEMAGKLGFRQDFMATGYLEKDSPSDKADLLAWVSEAPEFSHRKFSFILIFIPILTFTVLFLAIFSFISPTWILLYMAVPFGIVGAYLKKITRKYRMLSKKSDLLKEYSGLLALMEKEAFTSPRMTGLKDDLKGKGGMPSEATKKLSVILDAFDARNNMIMGFLLNFLFLWDLLQVRRTELWQAAHRDDLPRWLEVLAETDAICSLAGFHYNNPGSIFPEISADTKLLHAKAIGHPLVIHSDRIDNPATVPGWQHFTIITGANMAGKSTYLRTVGVNLVLAMTGSAVIAEEMQFTPVSLVTSIRTKDSLQKNESYFYAELKRLKYIINWLEQGGKLFILLDEILKGTNSRDKQSGSIALLEKLLRFKASGFVATHDLALGELEKQYPGQVTNKSFEVVIENDLLVFDYKLKEGVARQMNATFLMKKMGITD